MTIAEETLRKRRPFAEGSSRAHYGRSPLETHLAAIGAQAVQRLACTLMRTTSLRNNSPGRTAVVSGVVVGILLMFAAAFAAASGADSRVTRPEDGAAGRLQPARESAMAEEAPTRLQMQNVDFYVDRDIPLRVRQLSGTIRTRAGGPVLFDDKRSLVIGIDAAEVGLTGRDLSLLLNRYVFNYRGSPIRRVTVTTSGTDIIQKGMLHKIVPMPFEIRAQLSVLPDGRIRIHPTRTEILGLHVDKLMEGLGLALDQVISLKGAKGASLSGNDILLSPTMILPPPAIEGRVTSVRVEGNQVVQTFGDPQAAAQMTIPDSTVENYMYYRGGTLRFGKLMLLDAEMLITELDPADPFRFDVDRYKAQLTAGYSRSLENGGLLVFMRDLDKVDGRDIAVTTLTRQ